MKNSVWVIKLPSLHLYHVQGLFPHQIADYIAGSGVVTPIEELLIFLHVFLPLYQFLESVLVERPDWLRKVSKIGLIFQVQVLGVEIRNNPGENRVLGEIAEASLGQVIDL